MAHRLTTHSLVRIHDIVKITTKKPRFGNGRTYVHKMKPKDLSYLGITITVNNCAAETTP